jgi:hypothetical protein
MANVRASDEQRNHAQFLKNIMSPEVWHGKLVHRIIEKSILEKVAAKKWPETNDVVAEAVILAEKQFAFSHDKTYETSSKKSADDIYCVLTPHYFGTSYDQDILDQAITVVSTALQNLLESRQMRDFLMGRPQYRVEKSFYFSLGNTKVKAVPDLVMPNKQRGGFDIVDWKVATTSGQYDFQVGVYALAVRATGQLYRQSPGETRGYVINLLEEEPGIALVDPYKLNDDALNRIMDIVYEKNERIEVLIKGRKWQELKIDDFMFARLCVWR